MQALCTDGGGEFRNKEMQAWSESTSTRQEFTAPSTPQQNGIVERANRTIVEGVRAMLTGRGLPASLWADAAQHFVNIRNVCPRESLGGKTPYEAFTGKRPHYNSIHVFGAPTWYWVKKEDRPAPEGGASFLAYGRISMSSRLAPDVFAFLTPRRER